MLADGYLPETFTHEKLEKNYVKAVGKGLLKVMSKMGISTQQSYRGAQIFEAIGPQQRRSSTSSSRWTPSRIEGVGLEEVAEESLRRHEHAYPRREVPEMLDLDVGGQYQWRRKGEAHIFSPDVVAKLQHATQINSRERVQKFCQLIDEQQTAACSRCAACWSSSKADNPIPLEEVEPATEIVKRFATGAMSYGSISKEAHETLAIAMNRIGGKSNTGEGGEDPGALQARRQRRSAAPAPSSKWPAAASASPANTWSAPRNCKSRWPRAPSRAKAANCPATRSTRKSPASGTARRAWA